jgi:hypothetical protein
MKLATSRGYLEQSLPRQKRMAVATLADSKLATVKCIVMKRVAEIVTLASGKLERRGAYSRDGQSSPLVAGIRPHLRGLLLVSSLA